jgi:CBS domain-containing protein
MVLAVFNLIPAAPLDGGRVLRAVLWQRHGDRTRAARTAARTGQTFGRVLIALGLVELWFGAGISGLWIILLGWFVLTAARAEETQLDIDASLSRRRVRDVMTPDPITAPESITVARLLDEYVLQHRCSAFPLVTPTGTVVGLATLMRARHVLPTRRATVLARDVAWPLDDVTTADPDEPLLPVLRRARGGDGRVLVFDGGRLVGIISPTDVARILQLANGHVAPRGAAAA